MIEKHNRYYKVMIKMAVVLYIIAGLTLYFSCNKSEEQHGQENTTFTLKSPAVSSDSLLPKEYTCDGEGIMPPLEWSGSPASASYFAIIMHHEASPADIHWYIVLYNIPASVCKVDETTSNPGTWGCNSVNGHNEYAPPCSQGPGRKDNIITLYALSGFIVPSLPGNEVNREVLLQAMEGKIISVASMVVWYSRDPEK